MYPLCEDDCLFEVVRVTGLIHGMDVFAEICSHKEFEHDCSYSDPVERSNVIRENDNIVFETKENAGVADATSDDVIPLNRHVEFNNTFFFARDCELKMEDLAFACNQNVEKVFLKNTNIYFSTILELLPKLNWIIYYDKLDDGWEKELWYRRNQLKFVSIYPTKVTNFKILADLCRNGMEIEIDFDCHRHDIELDMDELEKYFQISGTGSPKSLFSVGRVLYFLKDPKMIELNSN
uniref:DUF38 domain-containing protein n=1 Tax=Panagrolaimus sp. JU765 TaxID=591449 RepID=A0AC34QLJ9_9BILA